VAKRFTDYRDQAPDPVRAQDRFVQVSDAVLGSGAYSEGYDSVRPARRRRSDGTYDYRGIGILYDSPVGNATVRTFLADGQDAEKILLAARGGTGSAPARSTAWRPAPRSPQQARDPLTDAIDAFSGDETFL
jgi:S-DNA-T family DNA segregation ATPase FtsK/SpoIIIE